MTQNRSSAVMQQRFEAHDSLDYFPTPLWATRALCEHVLRRRGTKSENAWDPACGQGHMVRALGEYFFNVAASDIADYGFGRKADFLWDGSENIPNAPVHWIITNPPFRLAEQFIARASGLAINGYAMLVRTAFLESVGRYETLFSRNPPSVIAQFSERVPMFKGRVDPKESTATAYCWLVWGAKAGSTQFMWIPPCRKRLERDGDYA